MKAKPPQLLHNAPVHFVGAACIAALSVLGWWGIAAPLASSASAANDAQRESLRLAAETSDLTSKTAEAHRRIATLTKDAQQAASVLRPATSQNERLAEFSRLAAQRGLVIREMSQEAARRESKVVRVAFKCKGNGSYVQCVSFLQELKSLLPDFAVRALDLKGNPEQPNPTGEFALEAVWFGRPLDPEPALPTDHAPGDPSANTGQPTQTVPAATGK